jgi:LysM repeat protein
MAAVMQKLTGHRYAPPVAMEISRLEMSVDVLNRSFGFGTDILTDWSIAFGEANGGALITLSLQGITFDIDYSGQLLQANLTAFAGINEGRFYFSAASPGDGVGWAFAGGLVQGSTLSVTNLLLNFMYPSGNIPGGSYGIPDLVIDRLAATLATDATNTPSEYTFSGGLTTSWQFAVFPDGLTLTLAAQVDLHGTRREPGPVRLPIAPPWLLQLPAATAAPTSVADDAQWQIAGSVRGSVTIANLVVSAGYEFAPDNSALTFGIWYKQRGIQATLTQASDPKTGVKQTILTVRLGDLSLGEILDWLIGLAVPGGSRRLATPWDVLYQVNFKNLSLMVNLTTNEIALKYAIGLDLGFAYFTSIGLRYANVNGEGRVYLEFDGQFLGQPFGGQDGEPLSWDVVNDDPPTVPGKGGSLLDLRYVGFGQHLALPVPVAELDTVDKVLAALRKDMQPVSGTGNPLTDPATVSLRYDGNSNWLFGLDATILDTVSLSAVFFDPTLYGGVIALAGERAGGLAGLRFELLYRKITDDIGELSADLRVPDQFRHLEFGEVSVTLGLIHVDIYTNGNFRVDLGFPYNQDFSRSFAVEVFPFVGEGGFYFAYLTGATSERVPQITNGTFSPVIEAGLGLSVGLGKDFQAGPLKAGLKVEVYGIFEGVFAPFNPYDKASGTDNYYWIQGIAGVVGTLYGSVDFVVIKAEVSVVARAQVSFVLEAHRPSLVELKLSVTAKAKIKILFVTIHFSFSFTLEQSFVIGSASSTPWITGSNSERLAGRRYLADAQHRALTGAGTAGWLGADGGGLYGLPRLRQQRSQHPVRALSRLRYARHELGSLLAEPDYRSLHQARLLALRGQLPRLAAEPLAILGWPAVPVFGEGNAKTVRVQFLPMFTVADPATLYNREPVAQPGGNQLEIVLGFIAENGTDPQAHGAAELRRLATDGVHHLTADGTPPLATMVEALFRWAAQAGAGKAGSDQISLLALEDLLTEIADPAFCQVTFGYPNLTAFLVDSLHLEVVGYPAGPPAATDTGGTFVALPPDISATVVTGSSTINRGYTDYQTVSSQYASNLGAYFQQLLTDVNAGRATGPAATGFTEPAAGLDEPAAAGLDEPAGDGPDEPAGDATTMAELIFGEYFAVLTQASLQAAVGLLQNYPVSYPDTDGPSLVQLAGSFAGLTARARLGRGQRLVDLAARTGHHPDRLAAANPLAAAGDSDLVDVPVEVTPLSIAEDNPQAVLATGLSVPMPALSYQLRAGQSLDTVAAAVPFVSAATPVTGLDVGTANQRLAGLLRTGTILQIPAFSYQPVAGDTQNLLTALLTVRNLGVTGIEHLDWYEQAISTLNPAVTDWSAPTGTVQVPSGYLNSTATGYTVHEGDTLARIAGTQALFQAMDNTVNPPLTDPVIVPAMQHPIGSTDTFASLVADFPGLQLADLITANRTAPVLSPLTVLLLPAFTAIVPAGQTLAGLAADYDLGLPDLVAIVETLPALYLGGSQLAVRDVPSRTVDELVADLTGTAELSTIGTQLSNFVAHGLRAPAPDDTTFTDLTPEQVLAGDYTGTLYGMTDLIGQQFSWPDQAVPVQITLTHVASGWLSFTDAVTATGELAMTAELAAANPRLAAGDRPRAGLILATGTVDQLDLTVDQASFGDQLPATTVSLGTLPPAPLVDFRETPVHYNFQVTQHWQAAVRPSVPNSPSDGSPGEPSLWPLPGNLQLLAGQPGDYRLATVPLTAPPGTEGSPLSSYCWAVNIGIAINRVADPNDPADTATADSGSPIGSMWLDGLYLVDGAAAEDTALLYQLWTYLAGGADTGTVYLLYPPNATSTAPLGYASDAIDRAATVLLKTNLSTETRDPSQLLQAAPTASTYSAPVEAATDFLCLLWQASVVTAGGFYLRYDAGGAGLPDAMFDDTGRGYLQVLCLLASQAGGQQPGGELLAVNNVAVLAQNVDASAVQLYAERTEPDAPVTRVATVQPGTVGFTLQRTDPAPPAGTDPTPAQLAGMLYSLLGYRIEAGTGFTASNEAVPQGSDEGASAGQLSYQQVLSVYPRADADGLVTQASPWLPPATGDPYAGISASSSAQLSFTMHDVFGNQAIVEDPVTGIGLPDRYTDRVAGLSDLPGTTWAYTVTGSSPAAAIEVIGGLQASSYLPAPAVSSEQALRSADAHAQKLATALYQQRRPGMQLQLATPLAAEPLSPPAAPLIGYLGAAYAFTSQLAGLTVRTHQVTAGQSLAEVAGQYSLSAETLLRDNEDRAMNALFASTVLLPGYDQIKHGETLNAFAQRVGSTAAVLLGQWHNGLAPVPAGVDLVIPPATGQLVEGWSLAQYAGRSQCTPADLGQANAMVAGLIADGLTVRVAGVLLNTASSTFSSLVDGFAQLGVTTTVAEIATANQNVTGIFGTGGSLTTYQVDRRLVGATSTIDDLVAGVFGGDLAGFCTLNGDLPGLLRQDTRLQISEQSTSAPVDPLRHFLDQSSSISLADFAAANAPSVLATDVVLVLPALLDPANLAATPYGIQPDRTLHQIATLFGRSTDELGELNADQPGIFLPDQPVAVPGFGSVTTGPDDSLNTLRLKFPAGSQPSLSQLIDATADQAGLLQPGAALVCPAPTAALAGGGDPTTIAALAGAFVTAADGPLLAQCNAALAGFLKQQAEYSIDGHHFVVGANQTLANTLDLVNLALAVPLSYDAFLAAMLDQPVVDPASPVLLPPPGATLRAELPAVPPVTDVLSELSCVVTISRPTDEIAESFADVLEVRQASSTITPVTTGEPATLTGFADALATAYGGELWLGTSSVREQGVQQQYLVRFAAPTAEPEPVHAIRQVALGGTPAFLGLPPLSNSLISRAADVRAYLSGANPPFSADSQNLMFQSVDVTDWARDLLATVDLALSPSYASAGYLATAGAAGSADFDALVNAKLTLASKISAQLAPIQAGAAALDATAAQASLEQLLRVNLSAGYDTDAVVQVPSAVQASWASTGADAGGHRLTGKVLANTVQLGTASTLGQLAEGFTVSAQAVVELLSATTNVLATGAQLSLGSATWTIGEHDSLSTGIAVLNTTPAVFADTFAGTAPLFRDGVALTVDGFTASVDLGDTLSTMADALDVDLVYLAIANQELAGLLTGTVYLRGVPVTITEQTASLAGLATAQGMPVAVLAPLIADQAVLTVDTVLRVLRWVPEYSLSPGKVELDVPAGALTLLLTLKNRAQYRRLFLNLGLGITALEYAVTDAEYVAGYQSSKWLHFVNPLPSVPAELNGAVIRTDLGQLDIPVPLRAYPVTPRLVNQSALASYSADELAATEPVTDRIAKVEAWTYSAGFELQLAAQDVATITVGFNYRPATGLALSTGPDPFPALAEYASNAAAIKADLATLVAPGSSVTGPSSSVTGPADSVTPGQSAPADSVTPGQSALAALAELATKVADNWGFVPVTPDLTADAGDGLVPTESYSWQLQTRYRSGDAGVQLLAALVLVRQPGTDSWGPAGTIPQLGYLEPDGVLRPLQQPEVPPGTVPQSLTYLFDKDVAAGSRLVYVVWYDKLNVVDYQNARAGLTVSRNQNLTPGSETNELFVYRTPPLTFTNLAVPSLLWDASLLFGAGALAQLSEALTGMFTDVLGNPPSGAQVSQKLTGNYGYRLAPPEGPLLPTDLVSLIPVFYRPTFPYADDVPVDTAAAVTGWFDSYSPAPGNVAFLSFDLQLFSTLLPDQVQPLVRFGRLDYQLD